MLAALNRRMKAVHPQLYVFLTAIILSSAANGIFETTFNNYLDETFHIGAASRGMLEFPRELPGLLCAVGAGVLYFLPEAHVAGVAFGLVGLGMLGLSAAGSNWPLMIAFMVLWSAGTHLQMPVLPPITMSMAAEQKRGRRLGQVGAVGRVGTIAGCLVVWALGRRVAANYATIFIIGGLVALASAVLVSRLRGVGIEKPRAKLLLRPRYWLYYALELLHGARKQIFITFGPWVLVKIFGEPPATFAKLWVVSGVVGIFFIPAVGQLIDRLGERAVLMADGVLLIFVCAAYGFAERIFKRRSTALRVLYCSYMLDQLLFGVGMARTTYISKIADSQAEVGPTLSVGVTMNHAISMSVPTFGGLVWEKYGYSYVFIGAAVVAVSIILFTSMLRVPRRQEQGQQQSLDPAAGPQEATEADPEA